MGLFLSHTRHFREPDQRTSFSVGLRAIPLPHFRVGRMRVNVESRDFVKIAANFIGRVQRHGNSKWVVLPPGLFPGPPSNRNEGTHFNSNRSDPQLRYEGPAITIARFRPQDPYLVSYFTTKLPFQSPSYITAFWDYLSITL